jgi:transcriptional regulator with XRE-family HTH domain
MKSGSCFRPRPAEEMTLSTRKPPLPPFARRLRALREAAGVSGYRLAQLTGLSPQALHQLERGASRPAWDTVCRLAQALNVSTEAFRP